MDKIKWILSKLTLKARGHYIWFSRLLSDSTVHFPEKDNNPPEWELIHHSSSSSMELKQHSLEEVSQGAYGIETDSLFMDYSQFEALLLLAKKAIAVAEEWDEETVNKTI